ncbi:TonB-dependent receptor plug domain-containing protein [Roseateles sp. MS654]|uniref:TonB-dependent receptor plug domain-containing protein n=1 Tax=Roseateles sp. MS654 TaxID=3412685 RepID=UPI003C2D1D4D
MFPSVSRARLVARSLLVLTPVAVACAVSTPSASAQTAPAPSDPTTAPFRGRQLDEVTVTATRSPMKLSEVAADLTVIDRDTIERQGFGNVAALLRNVAGLQITSNGGPANTTSVFIRGAETRHTVVLIDGIRIDGQSTGGARWENLPLSLIERVEVLKGPASALYGSDAIGGVVQIFTRQGSGRPLLDLGLGGGNLGQAKAEVALSGGTAAFDYAGSLSVDRGTGFNVYTNAAARSFNADRDGWRNYTGSLRLGGRVAEGQRLELIALKSRTDAGYDAGRTADDRSITESLAAKLSLKSTWSEAFSTQLAAGQSEEDYETKPGSPYLTKTRIRSASLLGFYRINGQHQLNGLLERREDRLVNADLTAGGRSTRSQNAVGLSYLGTLDALTLQAHGRHDDDSEFGGIDTGSVGAGYRLGSGWRVMASVGNAFRAPTLYQRGSVYGPNTTLPGVEELRPERAYNREAGLSWAQGGFDFALTAFHNRVTDLIAFGAAGTCRSTLGCYSNVARATLKGASLKGGAQLGPVRLSATADFLDPTDANTGRVLQRRAKRFGTLRAETTLSAWTLGASVVGSGARFDDAANRTRLGGYGLLNLDAQLAIAKDWRLQLNVDNAFNRDYQTANFYQQAPRTWFVSLRYTPSL